MITNLLCSGKVTLPDNCPQLGVFSKFLVLLDEELDRSVRLREGQYLVTCRLVSLYCHPLPFAVEA